MSEQLAIVVLVDVDSALESGTLQGSTYLVDNMKRLGSGGEGSGDLITAVNGSHWLDGSQAQEQILNWLLVSLGSVPPTLPRSYHSYRVRRHGDESIEALGRLTGTGGRSTGDADLLAEVRRIHDGLGTRVATPRRRPGPGDRLMDLTGQIITDDPSPCDPPAHSHPAPVLVDICGEAVDREVIYPAQYSSPDLDTNGWYWSASVDTSRPGTYSYTLVVELQQLVSQTGRWVWQPHRMTHAARLRITSAPMRNGFTGAGTGYLPIPWQ